VAGARRLIGLVVAGLLVACANTASPVSDVSPASTSSTAVRPPSTPAPASPTTTAADGGAATTVAGPETSSSVASPGRTSCHGLTHIGDSLTVGMLQDPASPELRLGAQYERIGVSERLIDGASGRAVVGSQNGQADGYDAAVKQRTNGFAGCWVFALGTNDAAKIAQGSPVQPATRIDRMMSVVGSDPVVWVDTVTQATSGDYANDNMLQWNTALEDARGRYPNLHVFLWSTVVQDEWFSSDGVHYTPEGYAAFARSLADGVAAALPA
jgi:lysophospholipase L1-like esterase